MELPIYSATDKESKTFIFLHFVNYLPPEECYWHILDMYRKSGEDDSCHCLHDMASNMLLIGLYYLA